MAKKKILFVDDDSFLRKVYQAELQDKGFEVYLAVDGDDGLQKAQEVDPDLIILDLIMPKKSGFELLTDLGQYEITRFIPVVVLSNLAQSVDKKRALDLGAVDYLVKDNTTLDIIADKINYYVNSVSTSKKARQAAGVSVPTAPTTPVVEDMWPETKKSKAAPVAAATATAKTRHNFCPECGARVTAGAKFCPQCGAAQT